MAFYRLSKRQSSTNIIEKSEDGLHWEIHFYPEADKVEGDKMCDALMEILINECPYPFN